MAINGTTVGIDVAALAPADVRSVYYGKQGACCCGCAGKHRYSSAHRDEASADRGYAVEDDEVSDRQVRRVLRILQSDPLGCDSSDEHVSLESGGRLYIAYLARSARSP